MSHHIVGGGVNHSEQWECPSLCCLIAATGAYPVSPAVTRVTVLCLLSCCVSPSSARLCLFQLTIHSAVQESFEKVDWRRWNMASPAASGKIQTRRCSILALVLCPPPLIPLHQPHGVHLPSSVFLSVQCSLRDLSSPTRDWTRALCSESAKS